MRTFWLNLGWLVVLVSTVAVALGLDAAGRLTYFTSLVLWGIPILYLWPVFNMLTANGTGRRRRALRWTAGTIVVLGIVLDFLLGHLTLRFPGWWGYEPSGMIGVTIAAWSRGVLIFPVEAAAVWLFAPFASILTYEFAKALTHHPLPTKAALFGAAAARARTSV